MFVICLSALLFCAFSPSTAEGRLRQFYLVNQLTTNITDAESKCENGSTLVTVYDKQDDNKLLQLLNISYSSGWIGAYRGNRSIKWSNGDDLTYTRYSLNSSEETRCAAMKPDGDWESIKCNETKYFMCYKQEAGGTSYNYTLITQNKTWFEAQLYCRESHTDLVSIRDEEVNQLVKEKGAGSSNPFWIGLLDDTVEWKDGGRSAYRNWKSVYLHPQKKQYAFISPTERVWSKTDNGQYLPLCQKSFIHISNDKMSWERAMDYCERNYSGPLCLESENDQTETVRELRRNMISGPVWVGLRQSLLFGFWIWTNGLQVGPWTNWKEGITPEHQISQQCGAFEEVDGQYKLSDKACRFKFKVLCETK